MMFSSKSDISAVVAAVSGASVNWLCPLPSVRTYVYVYRYIFHWMTLIWNSCSCSWSDLAAAGRKQFIICLAVSLFLFPPRVSAFSFVRRDETYTVADHEIWWERLDLRDAKSRVDHAQRSLWSEFGRGEMRHLSGEELINGMEQVWMIIRWS